MMIAKDSPLNRMRQRKQVSLRGEGRNGASTATRSRARAKPKASLSAADERLLRKVMAKEMDFIDSEEFTKPDAEKTIYDEAPPVQRPDVSWYRPLMDDFAPSERRSLKNTGTVLLTGAEERVLFLQYNYARWCVRQLQEKIGAGEPTQEQAETILRWYRIAVRYREQIAETNLALVLAMAKRTRMSEVDFADLVSEGNMALLRSVDKFDCGRGFKFSTYACRAILKAFSRQGMKLSKYRQRFPTDFDPALEKSNHLENMRREHELESAEEVKHVVLSNEADLTEVEQTVIHHRFGIDLPEDQEPLTLEQVGQIIGVTKERVRQIQNKALEKIRLALEANLLEEEGAEEGEDANRDAE